MVIGSSRAEKVEPSVVRSLTGLGTFNASVSGGTPDDTWAYANFLHSLPALPYNACCGSSTSSRSSGASPTRTTPTPARALPVVSPTDAAPGESPVQCAHKPRDNLQPTRLPAHDFRDAPHVERHVSQLSSLALSIARLPDVVPEVPRLVRHRAPLRADPCP